MNAKFLVEKTDTGRGVLLSLSRSDGLELLTVPDDTSGRDRISEALEELDDSRGAWLNVSTSTGASPSWSRRFKTVLEKIRLNDWTLTQGSTLSQHHTVGDVRQGVPLKRVPEVYHLFGNLREYSCVLDYMIMDREALDLVEDLVPSSGNFVQLDQFKRLHADHVMSVNQVTPNNWQATMHWAAEDRSPIPPHALVVAGTDRTIYAMPGLKAVIVRGELPFQSSSSSGTAVLQTYCTRSYERMLESFVRHPLMTS